MVVSIRTSGGTDRVGGLLAVDGGVGSSGSRGTHLGAHQTDQNAEDGSLPLQGAFESLELFARLEAQHLAFLGEGLPQRNPTALGCFHDLVACDLQQSGIDRVGDGFLLHGGVDDDALELGGLDRFRRHRCINSGFEDDLHAELTNDGFEAPDLGGVTGQAGVQVDPVSLKCCRMTCSANARIAVHRRG